MDPSAEDKRDGEHGKKDRAVTTLTVNKFCPGLGLADNCAVSVSIRGFNCRICKVPSYWFWSMVIISGDRRFHIKLE